MNKARFWTAYDVQRFINSLKLPEQISAVQGARQSGFVVALRGRAYEVEEVGDTTLRTYDLRPQKPSIRKVLVETLFKKAQA